MKERPILFSAPMVRAILAGAKTQTRRVCKAAIDDDGTEFRDADGWPMRDDPGCGEVRAGCPYGAPGDRLWVRERWAPRDGITLINRQREEVFYWADDEAKHWGDGPWKPSIHMPRWASRITLEVTGVRVERLQDISRGDAMAEGCPFPNMGKGPDPRAWYEKLWNEINGPEAWALNPWVWVLAFRRLPNTKVTRDA